ncbi:hypothetical protein MCOR29_009298 [Pyricularia oryzae]|nr:hypothetical protein MCOR01_003476 [Pyricularia oryzae]KAI6308406.1 hypothetical protein MCOR29_009298 [Pyricularia oryzae]KAI6375659.1 hypothetical protein MCOR32_005233 [Pyricularia oryzae]KAI6400296.1 hypothetical protein MCOR20_008486 [Pyricularia oryzae]KAI6438784.1 hypothetical protein MCOR22_008509 [Pyricularia oryzae]
MAPISLLPAWEPIEEAALAKAIIYVSISVSLTAIIVVGLRIWTRIKAKCVGIEDWLISAALLVGLMHQTLASYGVHSGLGVYDADMPSRDVDLYGRKVVFVWHFVYIVGWVLVKLSVCAAVLRITSHQRRRYIIFATMALSLTTGIAFVVGLLAQCSPLETLWSQDMSEAAESRRRRAGRVVAALFYLVSAVNIASDLVIAVFSIFILRHVRMKRYMKISVGAALSLGVLASVATIARLPYISTYYRVENHLHSMAYVVLWSTVESGVSIIAASLPMLFKLASSAKSMILQDNGVHVPGRQQNHDRFSSRSPTQAADLITIGRIRSKRGPAYDSYLSFAIVETDDLRPPDRAALRQSDGSLRSSFETGASTLSPPSARSSSALCEYSSVGMGVSVQGPIRPASSRL